MKGFFTLVFVFTSLYIFGQTNLWSENFTGEDDATPRTGNASGTPGGTWSVTTIPSGTFEASTRGVYGEVLLSNNTVTEGVWQSNNFSISNTGMATIAVELRGIGTYASDYIRVFYKVDGGAEILFAEMTETDINLQTAVTGSAVVSGTNLQIVVRSKETNTNTVPIFGTPYYYFVDDIAVTSVPALYSCATADWSVSSSWSTIGFTGPCNAILPPNIAQVAVIGGGHRIDLSQDADVGGVEVRTGGTLRYTQSGVDLGIEMGLVRVRSGGIINGNGQTDAQIDFRQNVAAASVQVDAGGSLTVDDITYINNANSLHYLLGDGSLTVSDDITFGITGTSLINNMTVTATVTDQISLSTSSTFTNNHTLNIGGITFSGAGTVNNNQPLTATGNITYSAAGAFNNNNTLSATNINFNAAGSFTNNSTVTVTNNIGYTAAGIFTNNGVTSASQILFDTDNTDFINNLTYTGNITCNDNGDDDNVFTNATTATANLGIINANDGNLIINNSGVINQTGNFSNVDTGSNSDFNNLATGTWNWSLSPNTSYDTDMATILDCSIAGNTFNYNGAGAQRIIPVQYGHLTFSDSGAKDANNANISLNGNWLVSGIATFTEGTGTVTFNGTGTQTITNTAGETFYNLSMVYAATASKTQLSNDVTVSNTLTLNRGGLALNGKQLTISRTAANAITTSNNGYIISESTTIPYGWVNWTMATAGAPIAYVFPFASSAGALIPLTINVTNVGIGTGRSISAATFPTATNNTPYAFGVTHLNDLTTGADQSPNVADRFWMINLSGYTTPPIASVTFNIQNAERPTGAPANPNLKVQRWGSLGWVTPAATTGATSTAATIAVPSAHMVSSVWALMRNSITLPIELIDFDGTQSNNEIALNWTTATELNNDYFTVERLNNLDEFDKIATIKGQGTTKEQQSYESVDPDPSEGKNYYRLRQTDFDGQYSYSKLIAVDFHDTGEDFSVYPNPVHDQDITIEIQNLKSEQLLPLTVITSLGVTILNTEFKADKSGKIKTTLPAKGLQPGMYIINGHAGSTYKRKIIVY